MITFSSLEPLDQKKGQAVGGVWDHYVRCSYLAMNNGLLMCRRCFACAQCGPCLRWIALKKNIHCTHRMSSHWLRFLKSVKPTD